MGTYLWQEFSFSLSSLLHLPEDFALPAPAVKRSLFPAVNELASGFCGLPSLLGKDKVGGGAPPRQGLGGVGGGQGPRGPREGPRHQWSQGAPLPTLQDHQVQERCTRSQSPRLSPELLMRTQGPWAALPTHTHLGTCEAQDRAPASGGRSLEPHEADFQPDVTHCFLQTQVGGLGVHHKHAEKRKERK